MVPPQPRLPLRRPSTLGWAVGLSAGVAALVALLVLVLDPALPAPIDEAVKRLQLALGPVLPTTLKQAVKRLRGYPAWRRRAALGPEGLPFGGLAASQVGYGPSMLKQFSSPRRFTSFRVVSDSGEVAFQGGLPIREIQTSTLGTVSTVWVGDFTPLRALGRYRVVGDNGLISYPFDVQPDVFDTAIRAVQRAFYYQRAFTAIDPVYAQGSWVHASDAALAPPGVVKGWHDAGDFSLYSASTNSALFWLLSAMADFSPRADDTSIPESGNGIPDLLDEARWGLEWLLSVQELDGGFQNTTCQERYGPYGTNWPERMSPYRAGEVGTIATGRAAGTLAFASVLFRRHDTAFAERLLEAAQAGYRFLHDRPAANSDGPTCPAMRQDGDLNVGRDVRMYAAAGLLLATGDLRFRVDFEENYQPLQNDPSAYRFNVYAALLYLRASAGDPERQKAIRRELRGRAQEVRQDGERHPFQWAGRTFWGSIAAGFQRTAGFSAQACLEDPIGSAADCEQVLANVHHALGRNFQLIAYVSGLPGVTRGRSHAFHQWLAAMDAKPFLFAGLVAGGPVAEPEPDDIAVPHARPIPIWGYWGDPAMPRDASTPLEGRYTDNDSYSTNELDVDWQGVTLYNLYLAQWWAAGAPTRRAELPYLGGE
jgi:endoglucanase